MRPWPPTLFGRLLLIFLGGLALAQAMNMALYWRDRDSHAFRISTARTAQRVIDLVEVMNLLAPAERTRLTTSLNAPGFRMTLGGRSAPAASQSEELAEIFSAMLARQIPAERDTRVAVRQIRDDSYILGVSTRLADGMPIAFDLDITRRQPTFATRLYLHLVVLSIVMAVLSYVAVRWVTRPLSSLATAAEELGRNIRRQPLAETGPAEVRLAARAFNFMQERLLRYVRTRESMLAAMSHDLKTPITRMRLRAEMLERSELQDKFARDLAEMESMVGATLGLLRGLDTEEQTQPLDVGALAESVVSDYRSLGKAVELRVAQAAPLPAKPQALKRCLVNLIDNALAYGLHARVAVTETEAGVEIAVRDEGPGIPQDQIERVLDPYYRVENSRNRDTGGHGLGLTIACHIVEAHGGKLELKNLQPRGLEVVARLPRG